MDRFLEISAEINKNGVSKEGTVDSAYNIHGYKGQSVIVATKITS